MIIATGFEPFKSFKTNPSMSLARDLAEELDYVEHRIIPVTFEGAKKHAKKIIESRPEAVVAFGLADGRPQISIEKVAINIMDSKSQDNSGYSPKREKIFENGRETYISTLPIYDIVETLHRENIPSYISYTAGTYVCNTLFYSLLYYSKKYNLDIPIGFIHLPSSERMALKRKIPYVEYKSMKKAGKIILNFTYRLSSP